MHFSKSRKAFTLVELSIVLVILGLLVGGVLSGQSLIHAAELRSISTQVQQWATASHTFRDKYFALPGDMNNATDVWGAANATPATCVTTAGTGTQTCNGDGDGKVALSTGSNEQLRYWQHLSNAGLIEGTYTGVSPNANSDTHVATNAPRGRISNSLWWAYTLTGNVFSLANAANGTYGNLFFGRERASDLPIDNLLLPEDIYNVDRKTDDGKPATGRTIVYANGGLSTCTTAAGNSTTDLNTDYLLNSTNLCSIIFRQAF